MFDAIDQTKHLTIMGYDQKFIADHRITCPILPDSELRKFKEDKLNRDDFYQDYTNYSVLQNPFRRFPYYSAANINGAFFKEITRAAINQNWTRDKKIKECYQYDQNLYTNLNLKPRIKFGENNTRGLFDKGHMTKREDVQWAKNKQSASKAAESTFVFTNAVPQHYRLNQTIWRYIEDYILHKETVVNELKISVFTGPVLSEKDPFSKIQIDSENIQLPVLFWKVIFYQHSDMELYRTAFLTNQSNLIKKSVATSWLTRSSRASRDFFQKFKDAATYQVNVALVEELTQLTFTKAKESFVDKRSRKLVLTNTNVRSHRVFGELHKKNNEIKIKNLIL